MILRLNGFTLHDASFSDVIMRQRLTPSLPRQWSTSCKMWIGLQMNSSHTALHSLTHALFAFIHLISACNDATKWRLMWQREHYWYSLDIFSSCLLCTFYANKIDVHACLHNVMYTRQVWVCEMFVIWISYYYTFYYRHTVREALLPGNINNWFVTILFFLAGALEIKSSLF